MNKKILIKICAIVCGISGMTILLWILYPMVSYRFNNNIPRGFVSGVPDTAKTNYLDDTKASNWFLDGKQAKDFGESSVGYYTISIAALGIDNATVSIGGEDLNQSLIQYPGTALPGQKGSPTVFGHSVLPAFYNPKNYETIFSTIPSLKNGDLIEVNYDGITYRYKVENKIIVKPTDISILDQDLSDSFLTLVTCVPPGDPTMPYREVVRARIVPLTQAYNSR